MVLAQKSTRGSRCIYCPISYFSALLFGWVFWLGLTHMYRYRLNQYQPSGKVYSHQNFLSSPYFPLGVGKGKMKEVVCLLFFKVNFEEGGK